MATAVFRLQPLSFSCSLFLVFFSLLGTVKPPWIQSLMKIDIQKVFHGVFRWEKLMLTLNWQDFFLRKDTMAESLDPPQQLCVTEEIQIDQSEMSIPLSLCNNWLMMKMMMMVVEMVMMMMMMEMRRLDWHCQFLPHLCFCLVNALRVVKQISFS